MERAGLACVVLVAVVCTLLHPVSSSCTSGCDRSCRRIGETDDGLFAEKVINPVIASCITKCAGLCECSKACGTKCDEEYSECMKAYDPASDTTWTQLNQTCMRKRGRCSSKCVRKCYN